MVEAVRSGQQPGTTAAPRSRPRTSSTCSSGSRRRGRGDDTGRAGWGSTLGFTGLEGARMEGQGTERGNKHNRECPALLFYWRILRRSWACCVGWCFGDVFWGWFCCFWHDAAVSGSAFRGAGKREAQRRVWLQQESSVPGQKVADHVNSISAHAKPSADPFGSIAGASVCIQAHYTDRCCRSHKHSPA